MGRYFRVVAALLLASVGGGGLALLGNSPAEAQAQITETRTVALDEGWNLAGWTGPDTPLADAIADILDVTEAAAGFDAGRQLFDRWNASGPGFLNSLDTLAQGQAVWLLVTEAVSWTQPVLPNPPPLALRAGFNLITWAGRSGLPPAAALAALGADLRAAIAFDKPSESFASFGPTRPAFLNDLAPLPYGAGFWLLMDAAAEWTPAPASAPAQVTSADGSATLDIPRGALPAGVDPDDVQITETTADGTTQVEGGNLLRSFQLEPSGADFASPATFRTDVDVASGSGVIVYLVDDAGAEVLSGIEISGREDGTGETVSAALPHFSGVFVVDVPGLVEVANVDEGEVPVGEALTTPLIARRENPIDRVVTLFVEEKTGEFTLVRTDRIGAHAEDQWSVYPKRYTILEGPLSGDEDAKLPLVDGTGPLTVAPSNFVCESAGAFTVLFTGFGFLPSAGPGFAGISVFLDAFVQGTCSGSAKSVQNLSGSGGTISIPDPRGPMYLPSTGYRATFTGTVIGPGGISLAGATVTGTVTRSDGSTATATGTSGADGGIMFSATSASPGTFTLVIDSIQCFGEDPVESGAMIAITVE